MSIRKAITIIFVICVGMLALGAEPTNALFLENTEPPVDKVELEGQEPLAESIPLSDRIGYNFTIRNDVGLEEEEPAVAYSSDRQEYLVVWYNDRPGNDDIRGQRVSKNGTLVGGPFYIAAGAGADRRDPDVTYNSKQKEYLVVWEQYESTTGNSIHGRRVSGSGQVLGTTDIVVRGPGYNFYTPANPSVAYAFTSNKYLVVWEEVFHPTVASGIYGQVVLNSGALDGGSIPISEDPGGHHREEPDLAYNRARNEYLVAWQQEEGDDDIYGRRVTGSGVPLNPTFIIAASVREENSPAVAAIPNPPGQGQFLIVWESEWVPTDWDIHGRLLQGDLNTSQYLVIVHTTLDQRKPAVAGNGSGNRYLVAWSQPSSPPFFFNFIAGQEVSAAGSLVGGEKNVGGLNLADNAAIASGPFGDFLVTFEDQLAPSIDLGIYGQLWGNRAYLPITLRNH